MKDKINIFWFRRDLRLDDNVGLYQALQNGIPVLPIFIFDTEILENLPKTDARVSFIHEQVQKLNNHLDANFDSGIAQFNSTPQKVFKRLLKEYSIETVYTNHDYEPYAKSRDSEIKELLEKKNVSFSTFKDHVIFEKNEVVKEDGNPYVVYTPYMRKWKENFNPSIHLVDYDTLPNLNKNIFNIRTIC